MKQVLDIKLNVTGITEISSILDEMQHHLDAIELLKTRLSEQQIAIEAKSPISDS